MICLALSGCYLAHELPVEPRDLREDPAEPSLALCRPRFDGPVEVFSGETVDSHSGRALDLAWTGRAWIASFSASPTVQWAARVTPSGQVTAVDGWDSIRGVAPMAGSSFLAAGSDQGLYLLDSSGRDLVGPRLVPSNPITLWMEPVVRPRGVAVLASAWGWLVTPEFRPEGLFVWSGASVLDAPARLPSTPMVSDGTAWDLEIATAPDGYDRFVVAQSGFHYAVLRFDDDATPYLDRQWDDAGSVLIGAIASPRGDDALVHRYIAEELAWVDVSTGAMTRATEDDVGGASAVETLGPQAIVAGAFGAETSPLVIRAIEPGTSASEGELVVDPGPVRGARLARHPCGFSVAWRSARGVRLQAYDCCPIAP